MGHELEALLSSWARSPTAGRLRPAEDGMETGHDFLGELSIDLLLAPSPPPPPVEDSSGSGAAGAAPQSSAPMSTGPAASPPIPAAANFGLGQQHHHQQQQQQQQQHIKMSHPQHAAIQPGLGGQGPAVYMLPTSAAGSGTTPTFDPSAGAHTMVPRSHAAHMLQLALNGNDSIPQHYTAPPAVYPRPAAVPGPVLLTLSGVTTNSGQQQGVPSDTGGDGKRRRGPRPRVFKKHTCQSDGCTTDLSTLSFYLQRNHICPDHLKADSYQVKGVASHFCQRCGQGHPLTEFEGSKRSCRKALERHNQRRRDRQLASTATGPTAAAAAEPAAVPTPAVLKVEQDVQQQVQPAGAMIGAWLDDTFAAINRGLEHPHPIVLSQQLHGQEQAQQQQAQQQQQQQQVGMGVPPPPTFSYHRQQPPLLEQQVEQQRQQPWVMLPRHLVEQHARHLLSSVVPAANPPPAWQLQQQLQQQALQMQQQEVLQGQQQRLQQPALHVLNMLDAQSFSLWHGEFGGSGI